MYTSRTDHVSTEKNTKKCKKDKSRQIFLEKIVQGQSKIHHPKKSYVSLFIGYKLKSDEY